MISDSNMKTYLIASLLLLALTTASDALSLRSVDFVIEQPFSSQDSKDDTNVVQVKKSH